MTQHRNAYAAARAAECAGNQGRFFEFHRILYTDDQWTGTAFMDFAELAGVENLDAFESCISEEGEVAAIEADLESALEIGAAGTPTLIINGEIWGRIPTRDDLDEALHLATGS